MYMKQWNMKETQYTLPSTAAQPSIIMNIIPIRDEAYWEIAWKSFEI